MYVVLFKHIMNLNSLSSINLLLLVKGIADKARWDLPCKTWEGPSSTRFWVHTHNSSQRLGVFSFYFPPKSKFRWELQWHIFLTLMIRRLLLVLFPFDAKACWDTITQGIGTLNIKGVRDFTVGYWSSEFSYCKEVTFSPWSWCKLLTDSRRSFVRDWRYYQALNYASTCWL